jgi:hypothetical protein
MYGWPVLILGVPIWLRNFALFAKVGGPQIHLHFFQICGPSANVEICELADQMLRFANSNLRRSFGFWDSF